MRHSAVGVGEGLDGDDLDEEAAQRDEVGERLPWSSHASHTLRRSAVCSFGLFQTTA